ncbi:hypothetical protein TB1_016636 [Malus domestica]
MAPPERDGEVDFISVDPKPAVVDTETDLKASKAAVEEAEAADWKKQTSSVVGGKERNFDLQLDLEKTDSISGNKLP